MTGIRQRLDLNEEAKEGFVEIVSALALNVLYLISSASSLVLVHEGISPHLRRLISCGVSEQTAGNSGSPNA